MKRATLAARHAALVERCRLERHELVATTATMFALLPRPRSARDWFAMARRLIRILARCASRNRTGS